MNTVATLSRLFASIQADIDRADTTFQERAASELAILNSASMYALESQGKRLRTAITLLSGKFNNYRLDKLLLLSVAFEMVHLATLIHDDIVDEAATRRDKPTVNTLWGNKIAILLGDYYFAKTAGLIADIDDSRITQLFSDTVAAVCEGTILEMTTVGHIDLTVEAYYKKIEYKTASLIAGCAKGGAILSQSSNEEIELLYSYGINLVSLSSLLTIFSITLRINQLLVNLLVMTCAREWSPCRSFMLCKMLHSTVVSRKYRVCLTDRSKKKRIYERWSPG